MYVQEAGFGADILHCLLRGSPFEIRIVATRDVAQEVRLNFVLEILVNEHMLLGFDFPICQTSAVIIRTRSEGNL